MGLPRLRSRIVGLLIDAVALLSLLLCLATMVLWVRSYFVGEGFVWKPSTDAVYFSTYVARGGVRMDRGEYHFDMAPYFDYQPDPTPTRPVGFHPKTITDAFGFDWHQGTDSQNQPHAFLHADQAQNTLPSDGFQVEPKAHIGDFHHDPFVSAS